MKPGIKTTEFWATLLGTIIVAGTAELGLSLNEASVASIAAMVITYVVGRVMNKNTQAKIDQKS
jgi:membrane protein DedA with SNARE-associated domain